MTRARPRMTAASRLLARCAWCLASSCLATTAFAAPPPSRSRGAARPAPPQPQAPTPPASIEVRVVQIAGSQAYLQPGAKGGVHRGATVIINRKEYSVVEATGSFAAIEVGGDVLHEMDRGRASIVEAQAEKTKELARPQPLSTWEHAWSSMEAPAASRKPRFVPLGEAASDRRWDVRLSIAAGSVIPLGRGGGIGSAELNARVHAEPMGPAASFDLDVSLQQWFAANLDVRNGAGARPAIVVRELLFGHETSSFYAGVGRMRYAASTLGTLDGVRVHVPVGAGFSAGAFGGLLPDPLSGEPSLDAQRFGVEASYSRPELGLRPEAAVVLHGSTFRGSLDERRLSGTFGLYPGASRVGGYFEVSNFDATNPWNASTIELTALGLDASLRMGVLHVGARFDALQPVRSRWLASFLPSSWFCRTAPGMAPGAVEPCDGSVSTRATGSVEAGLELDDVALTAGATTTRDLTQTGAAPDMTGGFVTGRIVRIEKVARIDGAASYAQSTYLGMLAGSFGPGVTLFGDALDLSLSYRTATLRYRSLGTLLAQQGLGLTVGIFPSSQLVVSAQGEATVGDDGKALLLFATVMWRPRF